MSTLFETIPTEKQATLVLEKETIEIKEVCPYRLEGIDLSALAVLEAESPTGFFERVFDKIRDILSGDFFDYKVGYIANIDRDTRKAKNTILSKLTYDYIEEHYEDEYHVPYGLQLDINQLQPFFNAMDNAITEVENEIESFKEILGKFISNESYRTLPIKLKPMELHNAVTLLSTLNVIVKENDFSATGVQLGVLVGNAKTFHETTVLINRTIHNHNEHDIADFQDRVKSLEQLIDVTKTVVIDDSVNNALSNDIVDRIGKLANVITTIGKAYYVLIEMCKLLIVIADDLKSK